jgi:hypothetical protein
VHALYSYLDRHPQRARYVFAALFAQENEDGTPPAVLEEEEPLVDAVQNAMGDIADRMDAREGMASTFDEEADLIFNPFPARIVLRVPGTVIANDGFAATKGEALTIEPVDLYEMMTALEGKWISPDPLAALLRDQNVDVAAFASAERHSTASVSSLDVANELRARLARPASYVVRWRD